MLLLQGKKALVFGVLNDKSIAWEIAQAFHEQGAELAITYADKAHEKRVRLLAESLDAKLIHPCNITNDEEIKEVLRKIEVLWGALDIIIHAVAFAEKSELAGTILNTSREGFAATLDISVYSLLGIMKEALPVMRGRNTAVLTLSYYGAAKVFPNYNVMGVAKAALEALVRYLAVAAGSEGIRVNAISAGPVRTLASFGITGFSQVFGHVAAKAPLCRNITQGDIARSAVYLCSDLACSVTGEIHYVDSGYNVIGA
ncbi:enoyl-ACP reductase FabI [Trichlorobacter lovleyi]|uniref:Enoyl-[acyl-carrier-protein] reductase [NADH] n=1 Tax=Trichlorobacter lovleyi (strain ATCC BAA-1151 / DSM 17278 / SZ) TaxID=398767 RepID=B3E224_TRIL1|nr:enoyl-ACP reductase [Trichlorobacter lovleyi]ACD97127.1 short-chain dehydrogenase/reductase SDR [Trichlorobacter lovleyi SZ]